MRFSSRKPLGVGWGGLHTLLTLQGQNLPCFLKAYWGRISKAFLLCSQQNTRVLVFTSDSMAPTIRFLCRAQWPGGCLQQNTKQGSISEFRNDNNIPHPLWQRSPPSRWYYLHLCLSIPCGRINWLIQAMHWANERARVTIQGFFISYTVPGHLQQTVSLYLYLIDSSKVYFIYKRKLYLLFSPF